MLMEKKSPFANGNKENKRAEIQLVCSFYLSCAVLQHIYLYAIILLDDERSQIADGVVFGCSKRRSCEKK